MQQDRRTIGPREGPETETEWEVEDRHAEEVRCVSAIGYYYKVSRYRVVRRGIFRSMEILASRDGSEIKQ